mgnify:CR=1 FL=1
MQEKLIYILSSIVAAVSLFSCTVQDKSEQESPAVRIQSLVVQPRPSLAVTRYVGAIEAASETPLSMQTPGRVTNLYCREGESVRKGQVLLRIDSAQAVNALRSTEAALRHAQDGYDRAKKVHAKGAITDQKMVEIESQLAQARSLYAAARQQMNECRLVAPCAGVVNGLDIHVGQTVVPGIKLLSILNTSAFSVRFTVPEAEVGGVAIGQKGKVECTALDTILPIVVTGKTLAASPITHTYELTASVTGGENILMSGMVAKVQLMENDSSSANIIIPAQCIRLMPSGHTVWVVEQGRAQRREITIGGYLADGVRVTSGLQPGDSLVVEGYQKLYKDCKVSE